MGEYLSPGVYVEEMAGAQPVQPAGTSTAAFVGFAEKGPIDKPVFITNYGEYEATFGGVCEYITADGTEKQAYLPYVVRNFFDNGGGRCYIVRVAQETRPSAILVTDYAVASDRTNPTTESSFTISGSATLAIKPASEGNWASKYRVKVSHTTENEQLDTAGNSSKTFKVSVIKAGTKSEGTGASKKAIGDTVVEEFDELNLDPKSSDYIVNRIKEKSNYITLEKSDITGTTTKESTITHGTLRFAHTVDTTAGSQDDGSCLSAVAETDFTAEGRAVRALAIIDELNIVAVPDAHNVANSEINILADAKTYVDNRADSILVVESTLDEADPAKGSRQRLASKNTAYYTPWVKVTNKVDGTKMDLPPCGAIAGIYARTDRNRGVFKAPAGTMDGGVNGIVGLEKPINKSKQSQLNPIGINCIREMPNVGNVVWGTRTTSPDAQWRYIPVRRLILFIEKSLEKAAQSAVFEPNDQKLWSRIKRDFSGFLRGIWKEGGLFGASEDQAFFVKIDEENNPQSSRDAGKLIINIGVAPVKPAEFVIIRIEQTQNA